MCMTLHALHDDAIGCTYMGPQLAKKKHSNLVCFNVVFVETKTMVHLTQLIPLSSTYLQNKLCVKAFSVLISCSCQKSQMVNQMQSL